MEKVCIVCICLWEISTDQLLDVTSDSSYFSGLKVF